MAKLFANLDKLKDTPRPNIVLADQTIQQGATTVNTNFTSKISLANRLDQSNLGTTKHLPEYFLSDLQTGNLKIKKFGVLQHTSDVIIKYTPNPLDQGGISPTIIKFNPTQGGTTITPVVTDSLKRQGTSLANGIYTSLIKIGKPIPVDSVLHGSVTITNPPQKVNQGSGTNAVYSINTKTVGIRQGMSWNGLQFESLIKITSPTSEDFAAQQASTHGIKTLAYTADRSIAFFTPQIKHGSEIPSTADYNADKSNAIDNPELKHGTQTLDLLDYNADKSAALDNPQTKHGSQEPRNQVGDGKNFNPQGPSSNIVSFLGGEYQKDTPFSQASTLFKPDTAKDYTTVGTKIGGPLKSGGTLINYGGYKSPEKNKGTNTPNTLANVLSGPTWDRYVKARKEIVKSSDGRGLGEYNKPKGLNPATGKQDGGSVRFYDDVNNYEQMIALVKKREQSGTSIANDPNLFPTNLTNKEVLLTIAKVDGSKTISFTAFMTSINDTVSAAYGDFNYIGKQDTFKLYKGTTRQISLGFRAVALGSSETKFKNSAMTARELATKVNSLIQIGVVGTIEAGKAYTTGPFIEFSLTGLYTKLQGVIGSVKLDVSTTDVPWDVDETLPMYYDITLDITVLSTKEHTLFNSNQTFIG